MVRHSGARQCTIRVARDEQGIRVEVTDDGKAASTDKSGNDGNGLRGLAERAAALGGSFAAGPAEDGGFRLEVTVPLTSSARDAQITPDAGAQKTIAASQP